MLRDVEAACPLRMPARAMISRWPMTSVFVCNKNSILLGQPSGEDDYLWSCLRGKIGTLLLRLLKDLRLPLFCVLISRVFSPHTLLEILSCQRRKSWRTTSISNDTSNHDWRRHLGRCTTPRGSGAYPGTETNIFPAGYARLSIRHSELMDCTGDIFVSGLA